LYVQTARWDRSSFATLFDAANPDASVEHRTVSTVATQALFMINHEFVLTQARQFAARLLREAPEDPAERIDWAYHSLFGRPALPAEKGIGHRLLSNAGAPDSNGAWTDLAHVLFCSNEFIYVD